MWDPTNPAPPVTTARGTLILYRGAPVDKRDRLEPFPSSDDAPTGENSRTAGRPVG